MAIMLRNAGASDVELVTELLRELYGDDESYEELRECTAKDLVNKKSAFFLAYEDERPIGVSHGALRSEYVNGKAYDETCGYLEAIYVREAHRKNGIARALVAVCEHWARENGCREFLSDCLLDNVDSYKFHLRLGFVETERCIFFRKELGRGGCCAGDKA
ncbi:MAG: GNAT family N-acetyltransferase [Oscillospiraceae bacterium]|nr:GNAT family N-acetyltransferase [Oscillospiraceae bacterium]